MASYYIRNAPPQDSPINFWARMEDDGGLARPNRYVVVIPPCRRMLQKAVDLRYTVEEMAYMCEATSLPGRGWEMTPYRYYGPKEMIPTQAQYDQFQCSFILGENMILKEYFDTWMDLVMPSDYYDSEYKINYMTEIKLYTLSKFADDEASATYEVTLQKAWPITVHPIPLSYADQAYMKLDVTFSYKKSYREQIDPKPEAFALINDVNKPTIVRDGGVTIPPIIAPKS